MPFFEYKPSTTLHYYTSIAAFEGIIKSKQLWLSDIRASNDPREILLGQEAFANAMTALTQKDISGIDKREVAGFVAELLRFARQSTFYTCCFSLAADELPMWREYADGATGVAIGFRPTGISAIPGRMQLVKYSNDVVSQENFRTAAMQAAINMGRAKTMQRILAIAEAAAATTSFKHKTWAYEKEVRIGLNQMNSQPDVKEVLTHLVSRHSDGEYIQWREPSRRSSRGKEVNYLACDFGKRTKGKADPRRAIATITRGPRCALSALEIEAMMQAEGFEVYQVLDSECAIQ